MPIYYGSNKIKEVYKDSTPIKELYNGSDLVYKKIRKYVITGTTFGGSLFPNTLVSPENGWKQGITYTIKLLSILDIWGGSTQIYLQIFAIEGNGFNNIVFVDKGDAFSYIGKSWTWTPNKYYYPYTDENFSASNTPIAGVGATVVTGGGVEALIEISWEE